MTVRYRIVHHTQYRYPEAVSASYSVGHLIPATTDRQRCESAELIVEPEPSDHRHHRDFFGNRVAYFSIHRPHRRLSVIARSTVETTDGAPAAAEGGGPPWDEVRTRVATGHEPDVLDARPFVLDSPLVTSSPALRQFAAPSFPPGRGVADAVFDLSHRMHDTFTYRPGSTTLTTSLAEVLDAREGVCQDFAHLMIGCLRSHGLAARYVSGYLETEPPPGQERLVGADASHAWASVFLPDRGWLDIDPTNDTVPTGRHITTAVGRDYADVTPLKGIVYSDSPDQQLEVSVDVERV